MTGPAPKPDSQRRRRNAVGPTTKLPAEGRTDEPPAWPLRPEIRTATLLEGAQREREVVEAQISSGEAPVSAHAKLARLDQRIALLEAKLSAMAGMEAELWAELWATPQAVAWERMRWTREVAQYVRWKVAAELGDLDASKEARQLADRLGLTPLALLRLRWEIVEDEVAEQRQTGRPKSRRIRAVE